MPRKYPRNIREARRWPTEANRIRLASIDHLQTAASRLDDALESVAYQRSPSVIEADLLHVARHLADVRRMLVEAGTGTADGLAIAMQIIADLMDNPHAENVRSDARALIELYGPEPPELPPNIARIDRKSG